MHGSRSCSDAGREARHREARPAEAWPRAVGDDHVTAVVCVGRLIDLYAHVPAVDIERDGLRPERQRRASCTSYGLQQLDRSARIDGLCFRSIARNGLPLQLKSGLRPAVAAETPASSSDIRRSLERRTIASPAIASSLTPFHPSEEATMMLRSQDVTCADAGQSGFWPQNTNLRWVHTLSQRVAAIYMMESTSAVARSCITPDLRAASTQDRWKTFLSLVSRRAARDIG